MLRLRNGIAVAVCSTVYATLLSGLTSPAVSATSVVPTAASAAKLTLYSTLTDNHSFVAVENLTSGNINLGTCLFLGVVLSQWVRGGIFRSIKEFGTT